MSKKVGKFVRTTKVEWLKDRRGRATGKAKLKSPLSYQAADGTFITVPAGFVTDGATVPTGFQWIVGPWGGKYPKAAALHDFLCRSLYAGKPHAAGKTRRACDRLFLEAMRAEGVSVPVRAAFFLAVRTFGGLARP